jgi:hypothetical protein
MVPRQASNRLRTPVRNQHKVVLFSLKNKAHTYQQLQWQNNCYSHNDVVYGDVNQFHKEADEPHNTESYCSCNGNFLEF